MSDIVADLDLEQSALLLALHVLDAEAGDLDDFMREKVEFWDDMDQSEKLLTICRLAIASTTLTETDRAPSEPKA